MTYREIIKNNCNNYSTVKWWPKYAFHYTDVENAVGILREGKLYSRFDVSNLNLMANDNASRQVIDMTYSGAAFNVRFYFRPLTPTQYHNEGFKHPSLRYCHDINANVPVPVFFLFDLEALLQMPGVQFSEQSMAGGGGDLLSGEERFVKLNFEQIYKDDYMEDPELEKKYRHAEIVCPRELDIKGALKHIVCRNDVERDTLLNLLRRESVKLFSLYKNIVVVKNECFENNGLYIDACSYHENEVVIVFSQTANMRRYTSRNKVNSDEKLMLHVYVEFKWMHSAEVIRSETCKCKLNYEEPKLLTFTKLEKPDKATSLHMKVYIENKLMCYKCWHLSNLAIL